MNEISHSKFKMTKQNTFSNSLNLIASFVLEIWNNFEIWNNANNPRYDVTLNNDFVKKT
jgi:hypothetical protein